MSSFQEIQPSVDESFPKESQELSITEFRYFAATYPDQLFHKMIQLQEQNELLQAELDIVQSETANLRSIVAPLRSLADQFNQLLASAESALPKVITSTPSSISLMPPKKASTSMPKTFSATSSSSLSETSSASKSKVVGKPINLNQALRAVKGCSFKTPGVKEICNIWNLCYYCKLPHPGRTAINCPNKGKKFSTPSA